MDELEHVQRLWAGTRGPSPQWTARTRNRLIGEAHAGRRGAWSFPRLFSRPSRKVARLATAGTLSLALAGGMFLAQTVDFGGGPPSASASADVVLRKAAAAAAAAEEPADGGAFAYVETKQVMAHGPGASATRLRMQWLSVDDSRPGFVRTKTMGDGEPENPDATPQWESYRVPAGDQESDRLVPGPTYAYLRSLPRDPGTLANMIRHAAASLGDSYGKGELGIISMALTEQVVPPETAAALFEAAQRFDDIQAHKDVTLAASGERGVAVTETVAGVRTALVFDAQTYDFLGVQRKKDGKVVGSTAIVEEGLVAKVGRKP